MRIDLLDVCFESAGNNRAIAQIENLQDVPRVRILLSCQRLLASDFIECTSFSFEGEKDL